MPTLYHTKASYSVPPPLKVGDRVALTATARKITLSELQAAIELLGSWGLVPVIGNTIDQSYRQFSDTDARRAADLQHCLDRDDIRAIWCARGGYGTARFIDRLDWATFARQPKWLVGYSDITALHCHIGRQLGISSLHATMPVNIATNTPAALQSLYNALFGKPLIYPPIAPNALNRVGRATGRLVGGNLSVLYSLAATPSDLLPDSCILFLEDLDEYLYHIDRMMLALYRSDKLTRLAGIVVGGMTDMRDNTIPFGKNAQEIIAEYVAEYDYPVLFDFPAGHIANNQALVMGGNYVLDIPAQAPATLRYLPDLLQ